MSHPYLVFLANVIVGYRDSLTFGLQISELVNVHKMFVLCIRPNMKIFERVLDERLREEVKIAKEQFGFMPGRSTTAAIFGLHQLMEKYREKQRELHLVFIDLEKEYDRVPRQELWRCFGEKMVPEKYVRLSQELYRKVRTRVRSCLGETESFEAKVELHQGVGVEPFFV